MLEEQFNINFGINVGKFKLGSKINEILLIFAYEFPRIHFNLYFNSIKDEIHILINIWSLRLRFLIKTQSLYLIDIFNINSLPYFYNGILISQSEHITTFKSMQKLLGPTFPG